MNWRLTGSYSKHTRAAGYVASEGRVYLLVLIVLMLFVAAKCFAQSPQDAAAGETTRGDAAQAIDLDTNGDEPPATHFQSPDQTTDAVASPSTAGINDSSRRDFPGVSSDYLGRAMLLVVQENPALIEDLKSIPINTSYHRSEPLELFFRSLSENASKVNLKERETPQPASDLYQLLNLTESLSDLGLNSLARHGFAFLSTRSVADDPRFSTYCCCRLASLLRRIDDREGLRRFSNLLEGESHSNLKHVAAIAKAEHLLSEEALENAIEVATSVLDRIEKDRISNLNSSRQEVRSNPIASLASSTLSMAPLVAISHAVPLESDHPDVVLSARLLLAEAHLRSGAPQLAIKVLDQISKPESKRLLDRAQLLRADAMLYLSAADESLDRLRELANTSQVYHLRESAARSLANHYLDSEQFEESLSFHQLLLGLRENQQAAENRMIAASNAVVMSGQQRLLDAQKLSFSERSSQASATQDRVTQLERDLTFSYFSVAAISTLLVGMIAFHWLDRRFRKEKERRQLEQVNNRQLESLIAEKTEELRIEHEGRIQLERSLERKRRDESIGQLTGNVAHDFNNLLQVVISTNEFLKNSRERLTQEEIELLETSTQSAQIGTSIVKQLLAYARQQKLMPTVMSVSDYLQGTESLLRAAVSSSCRMEIQDLTGNAKLQLDPVQLTTSLINLLSNAVDAMPAGGSIHLNARQVEAESQELDAWPAMKRSTYVAFDVIDQGSGVSEAEKARIFEPFYTTKQSSAGTGLGLSSVHGFVNQSGGDVKIFDHEHGGARVTMLFPVSEASTTEPVDLFDSDETKHGQVLVVEDNQLVGKSLVRDINNLGYHPTWAKSATEAKDIILDGNVFDLIISDVRMPGDLTGIDLYDWVHENMPEIAFVLMSGYSDIHPNDTTATFLQKPFTSLELTQTIRNELAAANRRRARDGKEIRIDAEHALPESIDAQHTNLTKAESGQIDRREPAVERQSDAEELLQRLQAEQSNREDAQDAP